MEEKETGITKMAIDYYFIQDVSPPCTALSWLPLADKTVGVQDGSTFKVTVPHSPYFYLDVKVPSCLLKVPPFYVDSPILQEKFIPEVEAYLKRKYEGVQNIQSVDKEDLEMVP
jgi:hypothetical protein